jgi:hypothetical protein
LHRARANTEDCIRAAKQTGLDNLPFQGFDHNAVWLEISLIAQDLIAWTQHLALDGELAVCEPKTLRYRLLRLSGSTQVSSRHGNGTRHGENSLHTRVFMFGSCLEPWEERHQERGFATASAIGRTSGFS